MTLIEQRLKREQNGLLFKGIPCCNCLTINQAVNFFIILNAILNFYMVLLYLTYLFSFMSFLDIADRILVVHVAHSGL